MEFWGVEVPSGKPVKCFPGDDAYIHVSQAALGESKSGKGNDRVVLKVKVNDQEVVIGTLSQAKVDQTPLDLIFDQQFTVSHNGASSVYLCGYKTDAVREEDEDDFDSEAEEDFSDSEEDDVPQLLKNAAKENGKPAKANKADDKVGKKAEVPESKSKDKVKPEDGGDKEKSKQKGKPGKAIPKPEVNEDDSDDDEDDESDDEKDMDDESDEDMLDSGSDDDELGSDDDEDDDSDDEDESEEEEPKAGKKRALPGSQNVAPGKKSKVETPSGAVKAGKKDPKTPTTPAATTPKSQGKKDASAKKTPGKENAGTPASGKKLGQFNCTSCKKNFTSEAGLTQHNAAKHN